MLKAFSVVLLLSCVPALAQQNSILLPSCDSRFAVIYHDERLPQPYMVRVTKQQSEWWAKSGQKKYKTFCLDNNEADYLVVWAAPVETTEANGGGAVVSIRRSFVYITRLSKRTPVEDALSHGRPEGSVIYEKEISPHTRWANVVGPMAGLKDLSQTVLEDALKIISKLSP